MSKKYIEVSYKENIETDELDFQLQDEILGDNNEDFDVEFINNKPHFYSDGYYISISELRNIIENLENKGSNYIGIDINNDHHSYNFYGYNIKEYLDIDEIKRKKIIKKEETLKSLKNALELEKAKVRGTEKQINDLENEIKTCKENKK